MSEINFNTPIEVDGLTFKRKYSIMPMDKYNIVYKKAEKGSVVFIVGYYNDGIHHPVVSLGEIYIKFSVDEVERKFCKLEIENKFWTQISLFGDLLNELGNNPSLESNADADIVEKFLIELGIEKMHLKCEFQ